MSRPQNLRDTLCCKHHIFTGAGTGTPIVAYTMLEIPKKHERAI
jgi:hypothetical protein